MAAEEVARSHTGVLEGKRKGGVGDEGTLGILSNLTCSGWGGHKAVGFKKKRAELGKITIGISTRKG